MAENNNNKQSKVVDLKPRESQSHSQFGHFIPNEELLQSTTRIKSQRDVILERVHKMNESRDRVSKAVFEKVNRDYSLQLETINDILEEKKTLLKDEIKKLYLIREKLSFEMNRHKEILEEAEFRHFLNEFTQAQYQEVENFESKEIEKLESDLSHITQWIKTHETLFDPIDLGRKQSPESGQAEITQPFEYEEKKPQAQKKPAYKPTAPTGKKSGYERLFSDDDFKETSQKFENTESNIQELLEDEGISTSEEVAMPDPKNAPDNYYSKSKVDESSYHQEELTAPTAKNKDEDEDSVTVDKKEAPQKQKNKVTDDSISELLESIKLEDDAEAESKAVDISAAASGNKTDHKLSVIQGDLETKEFMLKDNTSIGRSPSNDVVLKEPKVSRQHAAINKYNDKYILIDLKSSNGVYVNGAKVDEVVLNAGDEITVGGHKFLFEKI